MSSAIYNGPGIKFRSDNRKIVLNGRESSCGNTKDLHFIAINGLCQNIKDPWLTDSAFWLEEWLLRDFPASTVVVLNFQLRELSSWQALLRCGERLISELKNFATNQRARQIFLCHGMGGLVFHSAVQQLGKCSSEIRELFNICAAVFFGTPIGLQCQIDGLRKVLRDCASTEAGGKGNINFAADNEFAREVQRLGEQYETESGFPCLLFYEKMETPTKRNTLGWGKRLLVSDSIAQLNGGNLILSPSHHVDIAKLDQTAYDTLRKQLLEILGKTLQRNDEPELNPEPTASGSFTLVTEMNKSASISNREALQEDHEGTSSALQWSSDTTSTAPNLPQPIGELSNILQLTVSARDPAVILPCHSIRHHQLNPYFLGRDETLANVRYALLPDTKTLSSVLSKQRAFALWGLGGVGKTQTAIQFAFESIPSFPSILWARADSTEKLLRGFSDYALELGIVEKHTKDPTHMREALLKWYATTETPWLLIFDNADDIAVLTDFWPTGPRGSILVTSRDHTSATSNLAGAGDELKGLDEGIAMQLVLKLLGREQISDAETKELSSIVRKVECLPLALQSIAGTILETKCSLQDVATQWPEPEDIIVNSDLRHINRPTSRYEHSLQTVWASSLKVLDGISLRFLQALCFLDPDGIQEKLLRASVKSTESSDSAIFPKLTRLFRSRGSILRLSLVTGIEDGGDDEQRYQIHRLIQAYVLSQLSMDSRQTAFNAALEMVVKVWPFPPQHDRTQGVYWIEQEKYMSHVKHLRLMYEKYSNLDSGPLLSAPISFTKLLNGAAWYSYTRGLYSDAFLVLQAAERSGTISAKSEPSSWSILVDTMQTRGAVGTDSSSWEIALQSFEKAQEILYSLFDKGILQRPDTRESQIAGGIAHCLNSLGRHAEAEVMYLKSLELWTAPTLPVYGIMLCVCLHHQGKFEEALSRLEDIIEQRRQRFGPQDTIDYRTGRAYFARANIKLDQGRIQEAFDEFCIALRLYKATYGPKHLRTGQAYFKVGYCWLQMRKPIEAINAFQQAIQIFETSSARQFYERENSRTVYNLSLAVRQCGNPADLKKAEALEQEADKLRKKILGPKYFPPDGDRTYQMYVTPWNR